MSVQAFWVWHKGVFQPSQSAIHYLINLFVFCQPGMACKNPVRRSCNTYVQQSRESDIRGVSFCKVDQGLSCTYIAWHGSSPMQLRVQQAHKCCWLCMCCGCLQCAVDSAGCIVILANAIKGGTALLQVGVSKGCKVTG